MIKKISKKASAPIPNKYGIFDMIAYSDSDDDRMPHIVMMNPSTDISKPVNVRIHSECITGDLFGSYRCECGEQLDTSLAYMAKHGGMVIYLRQEGRGIGIINKLHAYVKQDEGYNTAEANKILGFGYDDRTYEAAIDILNDLGITEINLMTNNPEKIASLDNAKNLNVCERIPVEIEAKEQNLSYLKTKKEFFGHKLELRKK